MGGFVVKWWLLWALGGAASATAGSMSTLLWILVIAVVINTAISLYYYTRVIREMYLRGTETTGGTLRAPVFGKAALHVCAVVILLTGTLLIGWLKGLTEDVTRETYTVQSPAATIQQVAAKDE